MTTVDILNRLLQVQTCSLPAYLAQASPFVDREDRRAAEVLANIHANQQAMATRLADAVRERRGRAEAGTFPMTFTSLNFVAMHRLLPELINYQKRDISVIEKCVAQLENDPEARALAEEVLGAERAHLEQLEELAVEPAGA
jgi:rubrerythrin